MVAGGAGYDASCIVPEVVADECGVAAGRAAAGSGAPLEAGRDDASALAPRSGSAEPEAAAAASERASDINTALHRHSESDPRF